MIFQENLAVQRTRMIKMAVKLSELISPGFYDLHWDIRDGLYTHYWLDGGRGSTKSSFVSLEIILGIMEDPKANGIAIRRWAEYLRDSVYTQLIWAIDALGVSEEWEQRLSPLALIYKHTGQKITFRGADDPKKLKSVKFRRGYCKYIWYEEADEYEGMESIRSMNQSLMRGGSVFVVFYSYNPPKSKRNWVNSEKLEVRPDKKVHHSCYLDVPEHWLGQQFLREANHLKVTKPDNYRHEYLGEVIGAGGEVFTNLTIRPITDEEIAEFDNINRGLDFGYASDPAHYTVNHYDVTRRKLYIFYEIHSAGLSNRKLAEGIKQENKSNNLVVCDSAEPKSIAELCENGIRAIGAKKGPDSVDYGIHMLQSMEEIIIDPVRCPETKKEFYEYELKSDGNDGYIPKFPDENNHSIDATRYSLVFARPPRKQKEEKHYNFEFEKPKVNPLRGRKTVI